MHSTTRLALAFALHIGQYALLDGLAAFLVSAAMMAALASCTGDESSLEPTAGTTATGQTNVIAGSSTTLRIAPSSSATPESAAPTAFCATASRAVGGEFDFTSDVRIAELNDDPSLSPGQRALVTRATADAKRQVLSGSWSNDLLVDAVNAICGTKFTPVTMTQ